MSNNPSVPASAFVNVTPGTVSAGGLNLALNGLFLTNSTQAPIGEVLVFASAADVGTYFGLSSNEYSQALTYFNGSTKKTITPGALLIAQYPTVAVPAYLRGGNVSAVAQATLDALSGIMKIYVNGTEQASSALTLTGLNLAQIAAYIQSNFAAFVGTVVYDSVSGGFLFTTTATGGSETITYAISTTASSATCTTTGTVLTAGTTTGTIHIGDEVTGTDSTNSLPAGTTVLAQLTGTTGAAGTYQISHAATPGDMGSATVTSWGPLGSLVAGLKLTAATSAVLSQGAAAAVPGTFMATVIANTTNWASFTTIFNPDNSGNTNKLAFAAWNTAQNNRYMYVPWDTDVTATTSSAATGSLGYILDGNSNSGTAPIYEPSDLHQAAFICGAVASVNFSQVNGSTSFAYLSGSGITPGVTNQTVMNNLIANSYNSYVQAANSNNQWQFLYPGLVTGPFKTIQNYINQIWLNANLQTALMTLLTTVDAVPYVAQGYALIEAACQGPINAALVPCQQNAFSGFGMIQRGVSLSPAQIAEVNFQAGTVIASTLQNQGYYLQVLDPGAVVRGAGGSPIITLWYTSGGSVLQINMSSLDVL